VDKRVYVSEQEIIEEIKAGSLFGMVECDLETPEDLKLAFSEFQPISKHANVSREDIGDLMKEFAIQNNLLKSPTKALLNSYHGTKMLFATPLLKWLLEHGLRVTKIYQVVQYTPSECFKDFGQEVMDARRQGDLDPSKRIISDSCKLMG